jgi:hypothetical protein
MISVIRVNFRAAFFCSASTFRFADLSHLKPSFIAFGKRPAGATSDIDGNGEFPKCSRKLANPSDCMYIALSRRLLY